MRIQLTSRRTSLSLGMVRPRGFYDGRGNGKAIERANRAPSIAMSHQSVSRVCRRLLAQFVQRRLKPASQLADRAGPPVVEEVHCRLAADHMVVNCNYVE